MVDVPLIDYADPDAVARQNVHPNAGCEIDGQFVDVRNLMHIIAELEAEVERLTRLNKGLHDEVQFMRKAAKENRERHQEPVAWRYRYNGKWYVCDSESFARSGWDVTPLFTLPSEQAVTEAMVDAALGEWFKNDLGINPESIGPEYSAQMRAALEAAMEAGR